LIDSVWWWVGKLSKRGDDEQQKHPKERNTIRVSAKLLDKQIEAGRQAQPGKDFCD